jgi:5-formyltetrahydrofolate cyclo-ligase
VLAYLNFGTEFASELLAKHVLEEGKALYLPKVNSINKELELYRVTDLSRQVAPGLWDIPEPVPSRCAQLENFAEVDFVLLPGVAFTEFGARLGYGGGFYDKLLAHFTHQPTLVAAGFSCQVVTDIPLEQTDRAVEWLITEHKTICCHLGRE